MISPGSPWQTADIHQMQKKIGGIRMMMRNVYFLCLHYSCVLLKENEVGEEFVLEYDDK
jgi:hypothetical protein